MWRATLCPRDISTVLVYQPQSVIDVFLTRAHAQNLETERLSLAEARAISRRLCEAHSEITNHTKSGLKTPKLFFVKSLHRGDFTKQ